MHPDVTVLFSPPQKVRPQSWGVASLGWFWYQPATSINPRSFWRYPRAFGTTAISEAVSLASNCESDGKTWAHWLRTKVVVDWWGGGMKSYPALGGIVFWSTGIHYGIMKIWTNQGIHRSPIPCWLIIGVKSWHSHERPKDPKGIWKWWHLDISWRFGDEPNLEDISFGVYTVSRLWYWGS